MSFDIPKGAIGYIPRGKDICMCDACQATYKEASEREAELGIMEKRDRERSAQWLELTEQGRDVLGFHRVVNKLISLKLMEPNDPSGIIIMHELMRITEDDKAIIAREIAANAKQEKPQFSGMLDALLNAFTESLSEASKAL